jgi:hypothetical protein
MFEIVGDVLIFTLKRGFFGDFGGLSVTVYSKILGD